jgi:hypothetical protein
MTRFVNPLWLAVLAALTAGAPRATAAPAAVTYVGALPAEPPASVAVVIEGDTFLAYTCGRTDDFNRAASAWFRGNVRDGKLSATSDEIVLSATVAAGEVSGTLSAGGRDRAFVAKPVPARGAAGLYRAARTANGDTVVMGWIVNSKHEVAGGCQSKKLPAVALQPAKPLPPPAPPDAPPAGGSAAVPDDALIGQFESEPGVALVGAKVTSVANPPDGKVVRAKK